MKRVDCCIASFMLWMGGMIPFSPVKDSCLVGVFYYTAAYCCVHCCYDGNVFTLMTACGVALHMMMEVDCCILLYTLRIYMLSSCSTMHIRQCMYGHECVVNIIIFCVQY